MPKFLSVKTFKKLTALTLIASLLLNPIAYATSSYIEVDSQESEGTDRLHTMMPLSNVQDISHIEIDSDEQRVRVYRDRETAEDNSEPETSSASARESVIEVSRLNIYNLPWQLGQEGLNSFLSQHTAWLTPLSDDDYRLEFRGRLLGGMWWGDSSDDSGGYSNDYDSGDNYSTSSYQGCPASGVSCDSNGRCIPCITIYADSSQPTYNDQSRDHGRSYGKNSDGGSSSSDYGYTNSSSTNNHSRPATSKPAAPKPTADLSKIYARLNIKPPAKPAAKPAAPKPTVPDILARLNIKPPAKPAAKPAPKTDFSKLLAAAKSPAKPAAKPAPKTDLSKLFAVAKPPAKPAAKPAAPVAKPTVPTILAQLNIKPAAKPPAKPAAPVAKPAPKTDFSKLLAVAKSPAKPAAPAAKLNPLAQLESIRQAAAQKAQQQEKITEVVQVLQAMNREGLISQNLFTVSAFLSSYTPEKLEILVDQLQILKEVLREEGSQNQLMSARDIEDLFVSQGEAKFVPVLWPVLKEILRPFLLPAFKQGLRVGRNTFQKVDKIFQQKTVKRFIEKDWKKDLDIPQGWNKLRSDKQDGVKYQLSGEKPRDHHEIRIMKGRPESDLPGQRVDYVKLNKKGQFYDINGNTVAPGSQEAHIPLKGNEKVFENLIKKIWK